MKRILLFILLALVASDSALSTTRSRKRVQQNELNFYLPMQSGISNLPAALTINGETHLPIARYRGQDATPTTWPAWGYGETLAIAGTGAAPTLGQDTPLLSDDESVKFNGAKYYAGTTSALNMGLKDVVIEAIVRSPSDIMTAFSKRESSAGYQLYFASGSWYLQIGDGTNTATASVASVSGSWVHLIGFIDRSGSLSLYSNAILGIPAACSTVGNLDNNIVPAIGSQGGLTVYDSNILLVSIWSGTDWLDTHLQPAIAAELFARLNGTYAARNYNASKVPTFTRATTAYLKKWNTDQYSYHRVGAGWPRVERWTDANGAVLSGYHAELARTNSFPYSDDLNEWSLDNATIDTTGIASPEHGVTALGIIDDAVTDQHRVGYQLSPATANPHLYSVLAKSGTKTWAYLESVTGAPLAIFAWFNLSTCTKGSRSSASVLTWGTEDEGNGWCKIWMSYDGPAGAHTHYIGAATGDGVTDYAGAADTAIYAWSAQHEYDVYYPASRVLTAGSAATLNADVLSYALNPITEYVVKSSFLNRHVFEIAGAEAGIGLYKSTSPSTDNALIAYLRFDTLLYGRLQSAKSGGNNGAVASGQLYNTNLIKRNEATFKTNKLAQKTNGVVDGVIDTSCDMPTIDKIYFGCGYSGANQFNGLIGPAQIIRR